MLDCLRMNQSTNPKYEVQIKDLPQSKQEINCEIPWNYFQTFEQQVIQKLIAEVEIKGFRKGSAPAELAQKKIPSELIMSEMAENAINSIYPEILTNHKLDVIGRPEVLIKKIARDNPLVFSITVSVVPKIDLPDYHQIASAIELDKPQEVTIEQVDKVIQDLRQLRAYGHVHGENEEHQHTEELPEVDDEFAKSFGQFQNLDELKSKVRENLTKEAEQAVKDKRRVTIMDTLIAKTSFEVPEVMIKSETEKMLAQIESDMSASGASLEDYLKHIKKTKEELVQDFQPEAIRRARFQLILNAIAKKADILPTEEEVEAETEKYASMYPTVERERVRGYVDMLLTNEKALNHIENK